MELKDKLKALRQEKKITQKKVAESICVPRERYNKWETTSSVPDYQSLCAIADFYNVSLDFIFDRNVTYSTDEIDLLKSYRKLDPQEKQIILPMIEGLLFKKNCNVAMRIPGVKLI